jgi:hypothetical protein
MAEMTPELRAAIDVAKQRIKVDTYYPRAMNASLKGNAQGYWAGTALGFATGGLAGALIWGAMFLAGLGALPLVGWPLIIGVAGIGGTMGGMTGARIGAGAGSTAASTAELERRLRADTLEQEILKSPEKQRAAIEAYRKDPVVERTDTVCETYATTRGKGNAFKKIVDWKTMLVTVAVCTLASMALFGGAFLLGAGAGAAMGVAFGVAYPPIFASLTKHTADLLSGKMVHGKSQFGHIKNVAEIEAEAALNSEMSEAIVPQMHVAHKAPIAADMPSMQVSDIVAADRIAQPQQQITA